MKSNNQKITSLMSILAVIVLFQNCGQNGFQSRISANAEIASQELLEPVPLDTTPENEIPTLSSSSTGRIYYVSTKGSDQSQSGDITKPFKTIAFAVKKMVAGDTTYVRGGVYNENFVRFGISGTASAPIKLLNMPGESPIINFVPGPSGEKTMILIQNELDDKNVRKAISYINIEGFEIRNGHNGIKWSQASYITIRRNWIHHSHASGLLGTGAYKFVIDRNRINHNGDFAGCAAGHLTSIGTSVCNQDHGIYSNGTYFTITNNLIYDNLAFGIQLAASKTTTSKEYPYKYVGPEFAGGKNWVIANNTFAYQAYRSGITLWGSAKDVKIENNIFYQNCIKVPSLCSNTQGIHIKSDDHGVAINNNLAYATGNGAQLFLPTGEAVENVNYTASGNIVNTLAPNFVSAPATMPSAPNFALNATSPAVNAGKNLASILLTKTSFNGLSRPRGGAYDIGAYEY